MLTATHTRRAVRMVAYIESKRGPGGIVEFDLNNKLSDFDVSELPEPFECVEILEIVWEDGA